MFESRRKFKLYFIYLFLLSTVLIFIIFSGGGPGQRILFLYLASFVCFVGLLVMIARAETKQASPLINKELESNQSFNYDYFDILKWP